MRKLRLPAGVLLVALWCLPIALARPSMPETNPGKNAVTIRRQRQDIYFYPGAGAAPHHKVLFATGDGGHRGFAITIAQKLAALGYDVYALDTKHYLSSFTGKTHLTESDVLADFHRLADWVTGDSGEAITLAGWSTGAGLAVLAAADVNKVSYDGLIAISLGKTNILGWRWADNFTYLTGKRPNEPTFQIDEYLPQVAPLPVFVIQSSNDKFIPNDESEALFVKTSKPKHFALIHANSHSFESNRDGFFAALQQGMQWITRQEGDHAGQTGAALEAKDVETVAFPLLSEGLYHKHCYSGNDHHQSRTDAEQIEPSAIHMLTHHTPVVANHQDNYDQGRRKQSVQYR